jgi:hypothetical protein
MNGNDALLERVRRADPVDAAEILDWSNSDDARRMVGRVTCTTVVTIPTHRRRRAIRAGVAAVAVAGGLTTAAAAGSLLGRPAPERVREHLSDLDRGMPADLQLNPDLQHARAVAATSSGVLYAADLKDGGYCLEVASDGDRPRGAVCVRAAQLGDRAIEVTAPIPMGPAGVLLVGGRINDERVERVVARYPDGLSVDTPIGLERYWLFEVPSSERGEALDNGLVVAGVGADGRDVLTVSVPPLRDDDPQGTGRDRAQPIFVSTISRGDDLTVVLGVEGSVNAPDASTLELQYPDGTTTRLSMARGGSYRYMLPADRQDDFAAATGRLIARNSAGEVVASAPVSSVANARRHG